MLSKIPVVKKCFKKSFEEEWKHVCDLPLKEDILVTYIEAGWCINLRRNFKQLWLVSSTNPRSKTFLKSSEAIRQEKARHLQHYYWVIHPFSIGRAYWELWMLVVFLLSLFLIPMQICLAEYYEGINSLRLVNDCFCLLDVCINFMTGFYNVNTKKIILDPKLIARHYITGFFIIDLITSVPMYVFIKGDVLAVRLISYLKFLRIITCLRYMDRLKAWRNYSSFALKIVKFVLVFNLILLWCCSIVFLYIQVMKKTDILALNPVLEGIVFAISYSYFRAAYCLILVGYGDGPTQDLMAIYLEAIGLQLGIFLQLFVLANVIQILCKFHSSGNKYQQIIQELQEYVRYKDLPDKMRNRLLEYFDFKYQKHFYKETEILNTISPQLREEISLHTCRRFVERVDYFKDLPGELLIQIVSCLKAVFFLPNDVIVQAGADGDAMYFVSFGTVAVFSMTGVEVCHLADGTHFGEISLVLEEKRIATVVAVDPCELYRLTKTDFRNLMERYPDFMMDMTIIANERFAQTKELEDAKAQSDHSRAKRSESGAGARYSGSTIGRR